MSFYGCTTHTIAKFSYWNEASIKAKEGKTPQYVLAKKDKSANYRLEFIETGKELKVTQKEICVSPYRGDYLVDLNVVTKELCPNGAYAKNVIIREYGWFGIFFGKSCLVASAECVVTKE